MAPTHEDALRLTALGLKVQWLSAPTMGKNATGKRPIQTGWENQGYAQDPGAPIRPGSNLGVQTGRVEGAPLQVVVVDLDSDKAVEWARASLPQTPMRTKTSHGEHWFYQYPEHIAKINNKCKLTLPDGTKLELDVRGDNGNVVVAPSLHPSGHVYSEVEPWDGATLATVPMYDPAWLNGHKQSAAMGRKPQVTGLEVVEGLDDFLSTLPEEPPTDEERPGLLPEQFTTRLYNNCKARYGGEGAINALRAIALGQPYAPDGERNATLFQAVRLLAEWFPDVPDAKLEEWLRGPLLLTGDKPEHEELANFRDVLRRSREKYAQRDHMFIRMAKGNVAPTRALIETGLNISRALILGFPNGYHRVMQQDGRYCGANAMRRRTELQPSIDHDNVLGWAVRAGVAQFEYVDQRGRTKKLEWDTMAKRFIWPINDSKGSFSIDISRVEGDVFHEAVAPRRDDLKPMENRQIHQWLCLFGGPDREKLLDWLATFTDLTRPTAALFVIGAKASGKNLLALGLGKYWLSSKPTPFDAATREFNEDIQNSPFLFADEQLPTDVGGQKKLDAKLRELVTATHHTLYRKHQKAIQVDGCVRIMVGTNQLNFEFKDMLPESKKALAERILHITPTQEATDYLESIGGRPTTEAWVAGDGIIRHVMWLAENRKVTPGSRLLVPGNGRSLIDRAQNKGGVSADVCTWLCNYLLDPQPMQGVTRVAARCEQGEFWVSSTLLSKIGDDAWTRYVAHGRSSVPSQPKISDALKSLAVGDSVQRSIPNGQKISISSRSSYYTIDMPQLLAFAKEHDYDAEAIAERVAGTPTPPQEPPPSGPAPGSQGTLAIYSGPRPETPVDAVAEARAQLAEKPRDLLSELLGVSSAVPVVTFDRALNQEERTAVLKVVQERIERPNPFNVLEMERTMGAALDAPKKTRTKKEPKAKKEKVKEERTEEYFTPDSCPFAVDLEGASIQNEEASVAFWAPRLSAAMGGHPSTYARITAAYRAHRRAIREGANTAGAYVIAVQTWGDRGFRPWVMETSGLARVSGASAERAE